MSEAQEKDEGEVIRVGDTKTVLIPQAVISSRRTKNRIAVVEMVYYHPTEDQPDLFESKFIRWVESEELPYKRKAEANSSWSPLQTAWHEDKVGMILIENLEGRFLQRQPSEEEREAIKSRVIQIGIKWNDSAEPQPSLTLLPGESQRFQPVVGLKMFVRCLVGSAKYKTCILPA